MKRMKKLASLLLALVMTMAMAMPAFAAGHNDGSVTLDNATIGEEYKIYKVFDLTYITGETSTGTEGGDSPLDGVAYTYTKNGEPDELYNALTDAASPFTLAATTTGVYNVTLKAGKTGADISSFLKTNENKLTEITSATVTGLDAAKKATGNTVKWSDLAYGYYYVTSSVGSTVTIDSTLKDVIIKDKNSIPTVDKQQSSDGTTYTDAEINVSIGDTIYYEITIADGKGTDKAVKIEDTMSAGITNNKDYALYKNTVEESSKLIKDTDYTVDSENDLSFTITLKDSYVLTLTDADKIIIRYTALLNENASTKTGILKNTNTATLTYSDQTLTKSVNVTTMKFQLVKDNTDKKVIDGAKFKLYDSETGGSEIKVVSDGTGDYRIAKSGEAGVAIEAGKPIIRGLKAGTYYLEEIEAPDGYNKLTERFEFTVNVDDNLATITGDTYVSGGIEVENKTGAELPSTGGIGTTIFYIIGSILVVGAGVLLIVRRRMSSDRD